MIISISLPDDLNLAGLTAYRRKGAVEYHAYVQDIALHFRGGDFTFDPQSAVDSAVKNLRAAQTATAPQYVPRFNLKLNFNTENKE